MNLVADKYKKNKNFNSYLNVKSSISGEKMIDEKTVELLEFILEVASGCVKIKAAIHE
ncbi:UxaA family hydrolase [Chryseobacterium sp. ERMR1:04]|uniref:UxaA family hydrolase n=1 Tax=Chryseobacterium sp. ERMR1:04 TaxID=1705393 RepID=UPI0011DF102C|nr:UxaA family hydrolase [Chryseobacterium sp. ERMR1:04]